MIVDQLTLGWGSEYWFRGLVPVLSNSHSDRNTTAGLRATAGRFAIGSDVTPFAASNAHDMQWSVDVIRAFD